MPRRGAGTAPSAKRWCDAYQEHLPGRLVQALGPSDARPKGDCRAGAPPPQGGLCGDDLGNALSGVGGHVPRRARPRADHAPDRPPVGETRLPGDRATRRTGRPWLATQHRLADRGVPG